MSGAPQNLDNHAKFVPMFHGVAFGLIAVYTLWSLYVAVTSFSFGALMSLLLGVGVVIVMLFEGIRRYEPWLTYIAVLIGGPGLIALFLGIHLRRSTPNPLLTLLAVAPSALLLGLFYSLAVHMHQTLGGWPASIGNNGFSSSLNIHDGVTSWYFGLTLLLNLTLMPLLMLISTGLRQTRGALYYLGMNAVVFCVANGAMNLAPAPFLNWWWD